MAIAEPCPGPAEPASESGAGRRYAIVGAGMLGLALAHKLRNAGHRVTLYESSDQIGGLASAWSIGDLTWDRHYHVTLLSDQHTRAYLKDLGLEQDMDWVVTRTGCYGNGALYSVSNAIDYLRLPLLGWIDKFRLAATITLGSRIRNWRALEQQTVEQWLRRWSGNSAYEKFWRPLLLSKLGAAHVQTSAAFIWATIQRLYAARRSGMKQEMFGYVRGGYARVLERAAEQLQAKGVTLRLGARLESVQRVQNQLQVMQQGAAVEVFDRVILTMAPAQVQGLCPQLTPDEQLRLQSVSYLGIVCASLLLNRPLGGYYVTNLVDGGFPFTGIIEMSALVDPAQLNGHHLIYLPRYLAPDDDYARKSDEQIEAEFITGLQRVFPDLQRDQVLAFKLSRVRYVMPIPELNYSHKVSPFNSSVPGLYLANSSQIVNGTLNVNETLALAERAYQAAVAD